MLLSRVIVLLSFLVTLTYAAIKDDQWWLNAVVYQIYPLSFKDSNDDGIGDLAGITSKLDHLQNSGVTAVWLSPIFTSPMVDFGYDIANFKEIDSKFGTIADFQFLVKKAKQRGIKVLLDLVPNHSSDKHEWFIRSVKNETKYRDYYIWRNCAEKKMPNNWISVFGGPAWTYDKQRKQCYLHQFDTRQPDLNYNNPAVVKEMIKVIEFWLNMGVDGFRVDAIPHLFENDDFKDEPRSNNRDATENEYGYLNHIYTTNDDRTYKMVQKWVEVLDEWSKKHNDTKKILMTEAYTDMDNIKKYYSHGAQVPFNFKFITDIDANSEPIQYKKIIDEWMNAMKTLKGNYTANWVMGNHDKPRLNTRFPDRVEHMTMLSMTLPGISVTYYGDEIGMVDNRNISWEDTRDPQACHGEKKNYLDRSRDPCRTPFQWNNLTNAGFNEGSKTWLPVNSNYKTVNLANQSQQSQSHYNLYKALTSLKSKSRALIEGNLTTNVHKNVLIITRYDCKSNESVVSLINFSKNVSQTIHLESFVNKKFKSAIVYASTTNSHNFDNTTRISINAVELPANVSYVLQLSEKSSGIRNYCNLGLLTIFVALIKFI